MTELVEKVQIVGADGTPLTVNADGSIDVSGAGGGGAPADAQYYVAASDPTLSDEIVVPAFMQTVLDDTSAAAARATLGALQGTVGTSMPQSPSAGDICFRTDLGLQFYYDGTRWLSTDLFTVPLGVINNQSANFNGGALNMVVPRTLDIWVVDIQASVYVVAPNSGSAYWTVTIYKTNAANTQTSIGSFNTSADTAANNTSRTVSVGSSISAASFPNIVGAGSKTNAPGNLYGAVTLNYRLIGT